VWGLRTDLRAKKAVNVVNPLCFFFFLTIVFIFFSSKKKKKEKHIKKRGDEACNSCKYGSSGSGGYPH
jgi:competence protein ComGC